MAALTMPTKRCTRCHARKPLDAEHFILSRIGRRGFPIYTGQCRECDRERCRNWNSCPENRKWRRKYEAKRRREVREDRAQAVTLDAAPFAAWLDSLVVELGSVNAAADACDMDPKKVWKVRSGFDARVEEATVDAALQAEGRTHLDELYDTKGAAI